ncbi:cupin domain-containing protein [Shewanella colwelliana]|uniref:cupin domain-containing protein n=1 Tax=Shewanella colwelliana TaxID=23 RepID=UPI00048E4DC4|nr:cupin domain-containing protein [Shewanella colwelliana]
MFINKITRLSPNPAGFGEVPDEVSAEMFVGDLPTQHTHSYYENDQLGLYIGTWDSTAVTEAGGPYVCDEFMWVIDGDIEVKNNHTGLVEHIHAGEAFVIPKGYDCQWHQPGYVRKFYVISAHPNEAMPAQAVVESIIKPALVVTEKNTGNDTALLPHFCLDGGPQKVAQCYRDAQARFFSGTWESEQCESASLTFGANEFLYLQSGVLVLVDDELVEHTFTAGEALFIPQGVTCQWRVTQTVRAFYTIIAPASIA